MSDSTSIIISYKGANILTLPYKDKTVKQFDFKPGNNKMSSDVWEKIQTANKKRMPHYSKYLKLIVPEVEKTTSDNDDEEDEVINPSDYNADQAIELIKGCMVLEELNQMEKLEESGKDRTTVLAAIAEQKEEIESFLKKVEDEKEQ